jgi:hypothetical protein
MSERYELEVPAYGIKLEVDRLRREHHELIGELTVRCSLPGARLVNGCLNVADFNFSSVRARQDRAKLLKDRANTNSEPDWFALLEELCQGVFAAEREGQPAIDLRELPRPERGDEIKVSGLVFPRRHPSILFGDGGAAKSYTALWVAGQLVESGYRVGLFDWELCGEDHRDRLERLFGPKMPQIFYCRCDRPLTSESDRLRRIVRESAIDYAIHDSIAFACEGRPEEAEVAGRYFRAVREIGCGSLHIAHVTKGEDNDRRPFGSTFWHNGARCTWFVQAVEPSGDGDSRELRLGFFNRKANLGPHCPAVSLMLQFTSERTEFRRIDVAETPELAAKLPVRTRMVYLLRRGARTPEDIAKRDRCESGDGQTDGAPP